MSVVPLLFWNACTLNAHRQAELFHFMVENNVCFCGIAEARLKGHPKRFEPFMCFQLDQLAVFAHKSTQFEVLEEGMIGFDYCNIISFKLEKMILMFVYIRHGDDVRGIKKFLEVYNIIRQKHECICILGDFNLRCYTSMPLRERNSSGKIFDEFIESQQGDMMCLNSDEWTFKRRNFRSSILDLCLVTSSCSGYIDSVKVMNVFDSDHRPLFVLAGNVKKTCVSTEYETTYPVRSCNLIGKDFKEFKGHFDNEYSSRCMLLLNDNCAKLEKEFRNLDLD